MATFQGITAWHKCIHLIMQLTVLVHAAVALRVKEAATRVWPAALHCILAKVAAAQPDEATSAAAARGVAGAAPAEQS